MEQKVLKNGQIKCSQCGATDIYLNEKTGLLKCAYCRYEFAPNKVNKTTQSLTDLSGSIISDGAKNISSDFNDILTIKCQGCGAEVVLDTSSSVQARCHWCRSFLSINEKIPNGSVPDMVLPFYITKEDAKNKIEEFVKKRKFFAHPKFKKEFTTDNIMGVYFPYMLIDINSHVKLVGNAEKLIRRYTVGSGDNKTTYYDADLYYVEREFDLTVDDMTVEASLDKLDTTSKTKTTNIINAIMPFDTENCVDWNANYLKGFSSEKRDTNVEQIRPVAENQAKDIARFSANDSLKEYDRGVAWSSEQLMINGEQWKSAYLPVWLYSYQEVKGKNKLLHYVAVNARTRETMGSVPIHMPKLLLFSFLVETLGLFLTLFAEFDESWIFLSLGFIFYFIMYARYRNEGARHTYEKETKKEVLNLRKMDTFKEHRKRLRNSRMVGANNTNLSINKNLSNLGNEILKNLNNVQKK